KMMPSRPKASIGFYMFTSVLGGAERYFRDVVRGVDRSRFDVTVFLPRWAALLDFLALDQETRVRVVDVAGVGPRVDPTNADQAGSDEASLRRLYRRVPFHLTLTRVGYPTLRYAMWRRDTVNVRRVLMSSRLDLLHVVNGGYPGAPSA